MSDFPATGTWSIASIQKTLPVLGSIGSFLGTHDYLALVDPNGNIQEELHGGPTGSFTLGGGVAGNYLTAVIVGRNGYLGDQSIQSAVPVLQGDQDSVTAAFYTAYNNVVTDLNKNHDLYDGAEFSGSAVNSNSVWNTALQSLGFTNTSSFNGPGSTPGSNINLLTAPSNNPYIGTSQDSTWKSVPYLSPGQTTTGAIVSPTSSSQIDISGNVGTLSQTDSDLDFESGAQATVTGNTNNLTLGAGGVVSVVGNDNNIVGNTNDDGAPPSMNYE